MASSPRSGLRVAAAIVGGVGLVLGLAGFVVARYGPGIAEAEHARLAALPHPSAMGLTDLPHGRDVLVEGRIPRDQPAVFRDFVAYVKEEENRNKRDKDDSDWKTVDRVAPPMRIEMDDDGSTQVVNAGYGLNRADTVWYDRDIIEKRYSGLIRGEAVVVSGKVAPGGIEAMQIISGTRASYLAEVAGNAAVAWWLGVGFMAVGGVLLTIAIVLVVMAARKRPQPVAWPPEPGAAR
jgi:hypothetical protein